MKLEDALLLVTVDPEKPFGSPDAAASLCRDLAAGGVDGIRLASPDRDCLRAAAEACRDEACLCLVAADAQLAIESGADGVHLAGSGDAAVARIIVGDERLLGLSAGTRDEVLLGLELNVDYIVYEGEAGHAGAMAGMRESAAVPVYAGGIRDVEAARQIVEAGLYRLCITVVPGADMTETAAAYARLLGEKRLGEKHERKEDRLGRGRVDWY